MESENVADFSAVELILITAKQRKVKPEIGGKMGDFCSAHKGPTAVLIQKMCQLGLTAPKGERYDTHVTDSRAIFAHAEELADRFSHSGKIVCLRQTPIPIRAFNYLR